MMARNASAGHIVGARSVDAHTGQKEIPGGEVFRDACRDFEAVFIRHLLKTMRSSGAWEGFLKRNRAEKVFRSQLDGALAENLSQRETVGIARLLYVQLERQFSESGNQQTQVIYDA